MLISTTESEYGRDLTRQKVMTKKIMVAGGAGFIGAHLCTALINRGHQVLCVDIYPQGT